MLKCRFTQFESTLDETSFLARKVGILFHLAAEESLAREYDVLVVQVDLRRDEVGLSRTPEGRLRKFETIDQHLFTVGIKYR